MHHFHHPLLSIRSIREVRRHCHLSSLQIEGTMAAQSSWLRNLYASDRIADGYRQNLALIRSKALANDNIPFWYDAKHMKFI